MENNERVLAYGLSTELSLEDLATISGGGGWSSVITAGASGGSGQGGEAHIDMHWDF